MREESNDRPIPCRAFDPDEKAMRLGRDEWRASIVSSYPRIFQPPTGWPECREGWQRLIHNACAKIEDALRPNEGDAITLVRIMENGGLLHIFWQGTLTARARAEIEKAIEWANIESAETCEICGEDGRLYSSNGRLLTACAGHGRGKPVPPRRRVGFVRMVRGIVDGEDRILSCRRYEVGNDWFSDISPESLAD